MQKILNLAKDITKEIKQDKIRQYKYHPPQKVGYNELWGKVGPKSCQMLVCKEKDIKWLEITISNNLPTNLILATQKWNCRQVVHRKTHIWTQNVPKYYFSLKMSSMSRDIPTKSDINWTLQSIRHKYQHFGPLVHMTVHFRA